MLLDHHCQLLLCLLGQAAVARVQHAQALDGDVVEVGQGVGVHICGQPAEQAWMQGGKMQGVKGW